MNLSASSFQTSWQRLWKATAPVGMLYRNCVTPSPQAAQRSLSAADGERLPCRLSGRLGGDMDLTRKRPVGEACSDALPDLVVVHRAARRSLAAPISSPRAASADAARAAASSPPRA